MATIVIGETVIAVGSVGCGGWVVKDSFGLMYVLVREVVGVDVTNAGIVLLVLAKKS